MQILLLVVKYHVRDTPNAMRIFRGYPSYRCRVRPTPIAQLLGTASAEHWWFVFRDHTPIAFFLLRCPTRPRKGGKFRISEMSGLPDRAIPGIACRCRRIRETLVRYDVCMCARDAAHMYANAQFLRILTLPAPWSVFDKKSPPLYDF